MTTTSPVESATTASLTTRGRGWRRYRTGTFYLFASPWILGFVLLTLAPLGYAFGVSLTNYDGSSPIWRFVGLRNYIEFFTDDPAAWASLARTLVFTLVVVPLSVAGGLLLAVMVNQRIRARGVVRAIFFVPSVVPVVATAITFRLIFNRDAGLVNGILALVDVPAVTWLADPYAVYALLIMVLWGIGGGMVISLAALQDVPIELEEAARIDGAGPWRILRSVTVPLISPVLYFQVVTGVIASLQILVQPMLLAESNRISSAAAVPSSTRMFMIEVYNEYFTNQRFGYGSAMLWVFFAIVLLITLLIQRASRRLVFYQVATDDRD